ncbi:hypothetical protein [Nocardioides sp.]|uniref:hypothetical protein n=1 Tax=Nocardioides sp. TaxID=35761 RepID=UPI002632C2FD|nr:hypothetical protein [Nocardioides sp.]MDI6909036.1 hypothetical protein [Nocardioides sp.]
MSETAGVSRDGRRRTLLVGLAALVVVALVVGAAAWTRDRERDDEWAHGGDGVTVSAQIEATTSAGYPDSLAAAGVPAEPADSRARQSFVLQVSWTGTPDPDGSYVFVLLDQRLSPPKPLVAIASWDADGASAPSWAGSYGAVAEHYPWLARTAARHHPDGSYTETTEGLLLSATEEGEGVLAFFLPRPELATDQPEDDLLLAMVRTDDDGEVRWARKVPLT